MFLIYIIYQISYRVSKKTGDVVKLQSSLAVQSKSFELGVDFVFPPSQVTSNKSVTLTKIYLKEVKYRQGIWYLD